jgi:murein L,D-transpeptidase YcbB/YkuD
MSVRSLFAIVGCTALLFGACGDDEELSDVDAAQARVSSKQKDVDEAKTTYDDARDDFCDDSESYITAVDRYGKVFDAEAATVGDIKTAGADLTKPREGVESSAGDVVDARQTLADAEQELADAEAELSAAEAAEAGGSTATTAKPTTTTTTPLLPPATVDRVEKAEADLEEATKGVTDRTPLVQATVEINSAAYALEVAWLRLFADAGCLSDDQQQKAETAIYDFTVAVQNGLTATGYFTGEIDGVYGPATVDAVKKLQSASGLPATGFVDRATAAALNGKVVAKGGAAASEAVAHTAAVQSTLKLAGYWTGPVDGQWTPELTASLEKFQTALGVPATGAVDTATLDALEEAIEKAEQSTSGSTTTTTTPTTSTTAR